MIAFTGTNSEHQKEIFQIGGLRSFVEDTITATASGTQATGYQLTARLNRISVCATNADSVVLPAGVAGLQVEVFNDGAANAQVFGKGTDTIDTVATGTGVVLTAGKRCVYSCISVTAGVGAWVSNMGIKSA